MITFGTRQPNGIVYILSSHRRPVGLIKPRRNSKDVVCDKCGVSTTKTGPINGYELHMNGIYWSEDGAASMTASKAKFNRVAFVTGRLKDAKFRAMALYRGEFKKPEQQGDKHGN